VLKSLVFALFLAAGGLQAADEWTPLVKAAVQAQKAGDAKQAEQKLLKALLAAEAFGADDPRAAYTLDYLGTLYQSQDRDSEALAVYERAAAAFAKALGPDSNEAVESSHRLADAYAAAGRWPKAEPLYRALVERERARKPVDALGLAAALTDLGLSLDAQEQWDAAMKAYDEVLTLREKAVGKDSAEVAETLNNQGRVHLLRGNYKKAEQLLRRALAIDEAALGDQHPAVADDLRRLAAVLHKAGDDGQAGELQARADALDQDRKPQPKPKRLRQKD
jgi:tetratricopeptide (TPR) repeat protein